jgi:hypothetical protein
VTRLMAVQSADTLTPEQVAKYNSEGDFTRTLTVEPLL